MTKQRFKQVQVQLLKRKCAICEKLEVYTYKYSLGQKPLKNTINMETHPDFKFSVCKSHSRKERDSFWRRCHG